MIQPLAGIWRTTIKSIPLHCLLSSTCVSIVCVSNVRRFRMKCHKLCNHPHYCNVILGCILISSAMLAAEDPMYAKIERNQVVTAAGIEYSLHIQFISNATDLIVEIIVC